jgi:tryptophanyl-tRNA synthetase
MSAVTDSYAKVNFDPVNQPGVSNLLQIHSSLSGIPIADLVSQFENSGYGEFKKAVADVVISELEKLQARVKEIKSSGMIDKVLQEGAEKASYYARKKVAKVYRKVGLR